MKFSKAIVSTMIIGTCLTACGNQQKKQSEMDKTPEAYSMLNVLEKLPQHKMFMFGHHDDPVYGIGWDGDENRSDVKSVCGDYPAMMSFDLGRMEIYGDKTLDNVSLDRIRKEVIAQYERGGMSSFSWHVDNPLTGKDSWDVSDSTVVKSVLPGGVNHDKFIGWLDKVADYLNSIQTSEGVKVPVLFRPWHEHTGSWFWWGKNLCSTEDYKALWRMTYDRLQEKGATQLLYAYSPGTEPKDSTEYLERYPGDDIVDLIGVGPVTAKKMHTLGIYNGSTLRNCSLEMLTRQFGKMGQVYYDFARGIDNRPVEAIRIRKSIGCEHTLEKDISLKSSVIIELYHVACELAERLKAKDFQGSTLTLKVKFHDFTQITRSISVNKQLHTLQDILPLSKQLLAEVDYEQHPIRLLGLSVSNPKEEESQFTESNKEKWIQLTLNFKE